MTPRKPTDAHRREREEPVEHFQPIPLSYLFFVGVLTVIGFVYMVRYAGDEGLHGDMRTPSALVAAAPAAAAASGAGATADGAQIYASLCVACHQASGLGLPGVFPPLAGSEWLQGPPELGIKILLLGMEGAVTVKGQSYNGQMPAFKQLSDGEIAAVLTHVRAAWQNGGGAITAEAVTLARQALKDRTEPWKGEAELGRPQ